MNSPASSSDKKVTDEGRIPPSRRVLVFVVVAFALFMSTLDSTIVATALRTIQKELDTTVNWAGWTLTAYSLGMVVMLPLSAKLSMRFGPRNVFLFSVGTFTFASLLCGLSNNIYLLIVLRVIQALGGAGLTPSVTAIIVDYFGEARDRAVSLFGSIFPAGAMIGPIFGGLFVTYWNWRGIFFINVPIGLFVILMSLKYIPSDPPDRKGNRDKMDVVGVIWLTLGILAGMFAASYLSEKDTQLISTTFLLLVGVGLVAFIAFFRHIKKTKKPFLEPRFIYGKGFGAVNLINVIYGGATIGAISLVPLYAANRYGLSALNAGTLLISEGAASVILSVVVTMLLRRTGYKLPLYIGCLTVAVGLILLFMNPVGGISPYLWLTISTFLVGVGMGINSPPGRNAGLQLAPESSATIAAIRSLGIQLGTIISIAIATAILTDMDQPGLVQSHVYLITGVLLLFIAVPVVSRIPEHKGAW